MPEAATKTKETTTKPKKTEDGKPKTPRTNFSAMWPETAAVKVLCGDNPKKAGSKANARFAHYYKSKTVGDYLAAGGTYQDIAYDVGRQLIQVG